MKRITLFLIVLAASLLTFTLQAQITTYGTGAGTQGNAGSYFGFDAGRLTTGIHNTFVGHKSGQGNTSGKFNTFVGSASGFYNKTGHYNAFTGYRSGFKNVSGQQNTFNGFYAGYFNSTGSFNTAMGLRAGYRNLSGNSNVNIGYESGYSNYYGHGNVNIGYKAGYYETGHGKLYIDNSTTSTPLIYGNFSTNELGFHAKVGIGTKTPNADLEIKGTGATMRIGNGSSVLELASANCNGCYSFAAQTNDKVIRTLNSNNLLFSTGSNSGNGRSFKFVSGNSHLLKIEDNGEVSLGNISTPAGYRLYVKDGILSEKVKVANVNSSDWADYVFADDYHLNSTEEVEQFIQTNKHLPNVPSAKEVSKNGVDMVEMDATLLRQIEELWLHVIELKKENEVLKNKIEGK